MINISSIAGKQAYPKGAFYCASKHAVEAITTSLRAELVATPLRVSTISPGWVNDGTEFSKVRFKGDDARVDKVYEGFQPLSADDVADSVAYVATRPPHVAVADVYLLPTNQAHAFDGGIYRENHPSCPVSQQQQQCPRVPRCSTHCSLAHSSLVAAVTTPVL